MPCTVAKMWRIDQSSVSGESQDRPMLGIDVRYRFVDDAVAFAPGSPFHGEYKAMRDDNIHAGKYHSDRLSRTKVL